METQTTTVEKKQQKQFSSIEKYVFSISFKETTKKVYSVIVCWLCWCSHSIVWSCYFAIFNTVFFQLFSLFVIKFPSTLMINHSITVFVKRKTIFFSFSHFLLFVILVYSHEVIINVLEHDNATRSLENTLRASFQYKLNIFRIEKN